MVCAFVSLGIGMLCKTTFAFFITYFIAGFFLGVIFSVLVSIAVSLKPLHAGIAAATIGFVGGGADILSPLLTGAIINFTSINFTFYYGMLMCAVCILAAQGYLIIYKKGGNS
jgi:MFS family permease